MLRGMNLSDGAASVSVREVQKCIRTRTAAGRGSADDIAFIKVDRSRVKIGDVAVAVRHCGELQVVAALFGSAAQLVAAIDNARVADLGPGVAAVGRFPDALIEIICVHVPDIHFVAAGNDGDLASVNRTARRTWARWTCGRGEPTAGLIR